MAIIKKRICLTLFLIVFLLSLPSLGFALSITYSDFSDLSGLTLNGSSKGAVDDSGRHVLRLTDDVDQAGSTFTTDAVSLQDDFSFSAHFGFRISESALNPDMNPDTDGDGADGIVFVLQALSPNELGWEGGNIGYTPISKSIGIEFDTWLNEDLQDIDGNHIGLNTLGSTVSVTSTPIAQRLNDGDDWFSWIDYDGESGQLEVRLSLQNSRPQDALLIETVDLGAILESPDVYVGFTSGTAGGTGFHDIISFEFTDSVFVPPHSSSIPEPATIFLVGIGLIGFGVFRRKSKK